MYSVINVLFAWLLSLQWSTLCMHCRREESFPRTRVMQGCLWVTGHGSAFREKKRRNGLVWTLNPLSVLADDWQASWQRNFEDYSALRGWPGLKMLSDGLCWPVSKYRAISKQLHESCSFFSISPKMSGENTVSFFVLGFRFLIPSIKTFAIKT